MSRQQRFLSNSLANFRLPHDINLSSLDTENEVVIYAELAGINPGNIKLTFDCNKLIIKGKREPLFPLNVNRTDALDEINLGVFKKELQLPVYVLQKESVIVTYERGLLKITINKNQGNSGPFDIVI